MKKEEKEEKEITNETTNNEKDKKNNNSVLITILILLFVAAFACLLYAKYTSSNKANGNKIKVDNNNKYLTYRLSGNSLEAFDLYFLQLENKKENKIYSPLSIKYALEMLAEGAEGETKKQITDIVGDYSPKKYNNNSNMSFANALFVKDTFKDGIKNTYIDALKNRYNAEVIYDSFSTSTNLNNWVSNKTFKLVDNLFDDVSQEDFILTNALAIDMEWVNKIQRDDHDYIVNYSSSHHLDYWYRIKQLAKDMEEAKEPKYKTIKFGENNYEAAALEIGAVINKYNIVNILGKNNIKKTVGEAYDKWLADGACGRTGEPDRETWLKENFDQYIKEIEEPYKDISSSTDFRFYVDENVKEFAKELKEYNGTQLEYIAIMPTQTNLDEYIKNVKPEDIKQLINKLKDVKIENFKEGVITEITGYIPIFKFEYELDLMNDLKSLGITNVFDSEKADLSNLSSGDAVIDTVAHKANIEFSNDGIKAAAATLAGGYGAGGCEFDYKFKPLVEKIDLTFDKPYMYIIRDKKTGEVWFVGTVYEPKEYHDPSDTNDNNNTVTYGDVNKDGTVDNKDVTRLMRYIQYKDVEIDEIAADGTYKIW